MGTLTNLSIGVNLNLDDYIEKYDLEVNKVEYLLPKIITELIINHWDYKIDENAQLKEFKENAIKMFKNQKQNWWNATDGIATVVTYYGSTYELFVGKAYYKYADTLIVPLDNDLIIFYEQIIHKTIFSIECNHNKRALLREVLENYITIIESSTDETQSTKERHNWFSFVDEIISELSKKDKANIVALSHDN